MKHTITLSILLLISVQAFAEKMLLAPAKGENPECFQSYELAKQPKRSNEIVGAMTHICKQKGGSRVTHKVLTSSGTSSQIDLNYTSGKANEFTAIILTCVGDNPNDRLFSCQFSTSFEDL